MFCSRVLYIIAFTFFITLIIKTGNAHSNLKYFEQIHADDIGHKIVKRELHEDQQATGKIKEISFKILGRYFRLILSPKRDMLHSTFKAYSVDGNGKESPLNIDYENFLSGRVFGESNSFASLFIEDDGLLTGFIHSLNETYYIEPAWRHELGMDNRMMIAYKSSDVSFNFKFHNITYDKTDQKIFDYLKDSSEKWNNQLIRRKRQVNRTEVIFKKSRCPLLLVADYGFFITMGNNSTMKTANYLIGLIDRLNNMFTKTTWVDMKSNKTFKNIGFVIKKMVIHETEGPYTDGLFCDQDKNCNATKLLEVFSANRNICLAHLFTDHKFDNNAGGIAYVGTVCKPGNSAVSTSRNYIGDKIITRVAELIISHEFAHTWGALHDTDSAECLPEANHGGPYIMSKYSVTGSDVNNHKFSPCTRRNVGTLLIERIEKCFTEIETSFCGNNRVEGEEECDGGLQGLEDEDPCCAVNCTLRVGANCSHLNSECCQNCEYMPANVVCRKAHNATCQGEAVCTGNQADCPQSPPLPNKTECQERGKCYNGSCIPYCETLQKQSCMCDSMETTCMQCCRNHMNDTCKPIEPFHNLSAGTVCMKGMCYEGECFENVLDVYGTFKKVILHTDIGKTLRFLKDNIVGTVAIVTAIVWIFACSRIKTIDRRNYRKLNGFN